MIPHKNKNFMKLLQEHEIKYIKRNPASSMISSYKVWMGMDEKIRAAKTFLGLSKDFLVQPTMVNSETDTANNLYEWKCEY